MMSTRVLRQLGSQKGSTLIEIIIAVAIVFMMSIAISGTILQASKVATMDKDRMQLIKYLENALYYLNRDAQQARADQISIVNNQSFMLPLVLSWTDDSGNTYVVNYQINTIGTQKSLRRTEEFNGNQVSAIDVARNIDASAAKSNYSFNGHTLAIQLTATTQSTRTETEVRKLVVMPRVNGY